MELGELSEPLHRESTDSLINMHTYIPLLPSRSPATVEPNSAMEDVSVQQERVVGLFLPHYMFLRFFY